MDQFVQGIENIGLFALSVIVACVAIMLIISIMDSHPRRRKSMPKRRHVNQSPEEDGGPSEPDAGPE